jgi:toxin YoeB
MAKFDSVFASAFLEDQAYWIATHPPTAAKIRALVKAILDEPFTGIGKPEPLRWGPFKGCWSRRITKEHRLVYKVDKGSIHFLVCRYHY